MILVCFLSVKSVFQRSVCRLVSYVIIRDTAVCVSSTLSFYFFDYLTAVQTFNRRVVSVVISEIYPF